MKRLITMVCAGFIPSLVFSQTLIRVPEDQPTIQAGINAASNGDTVLMAEGTYVENILINKKIILGSLFVQDGDTAHISRTIIDGSGATNPDSGSTITLGPNTDTTLVIKGLTITGGKGNKSYDLTYFNYWLGGGGIESSVRGSARIVSNAIINNQLQAAGSVGNLFGGGLALFVQGAGPRVHVIIENNTVSGNILTSDTTEGGGLWIGGVSAWIRRNTIKDNHSSGTITGGAGGIMFYTLTSDTCIIESNLIESNSSQRYGGGFFVQGSPRAVLVNNIIARNTSLYASGIAAYLATMSLINNTVVDNMGGNGRGIYAQSSTIRALNNIVSNQSASQVYNYNLTSQLYLDHNLIFGQTIGTNSLDTDPDIEPNSGYYYLKGASPARDAGVVSAVVGSVTLNAPTRDFRDSLRIGAPDLGAHEYDLLVGVERMAGIEVPDNFKLEQNFPNPFNPTTTITYHLAFTAHTSLRIYDVLGREVATLVNGQQPPGLYTMGWTAKVPSGVYFYRLEAVGMNGRSFVESKKMTLIR